MSKYALDTEESLAEEMVADPGYFGLTVFRRNPCCYGKQIEANVDVSFGNFEDAQDAVKKLRATALAIEALLAKYVVTGEIVTYMEACEGCEVPADA